jgi:hypothetical protein
VSGIDGGRHCAVATVVVLRSKASWREHSCWSAICSFGAVVISCSALFVFQTLSCSYRTLDRTLQEELNEKRLADIEFQMRFSSAEKGQRYLDDTQETRPKYKILIYCNL